MIDVRSHANQDWVETVPRPVAPVINRICGHKLVDPLTDSTRSFRSVLFCYPYIRLRNVVTPKPDRLFDSMAKTYEGCTSNPTDVKELVPEFFYLSGM